MFADQIPGDENTAGGGASNTDQGFIPSVDGVLNMFLGCLVAASKPKPPSQFDSLYFNGSYLHRNAQVNYNLISFLTLII